MSCAVCSTLSLESTQHIRPADWESRQLSLVVLAGSGAVGGAFPTGPSSPSGGGCGLLAARSAPSVHCPQRREAALLFWSLAGASLQPPSGQEWCGRAWPLFGFGTAGQGGGSSELWVPGAEAVAAGPLPCAVVSPLRVMLSSRPRSCHSLQFRPRPMQH